MRHILFAALLVTTTAASARGVAFNGNIQLVAPTNAARHPPQSAKGEVGRAGLTKFNPYSRGQPTKRK